MSLRAPQLIARYRDCPWALRVGATMLPPIGCQPLQSI